jgi:hypothetical protein
MQPLKLSALFLLSGFVAGATNAQIQVQLKFSRLQYIAYEPVMANVTITNRAGRDIDLHDDGTQRWFGFEITGSDGQSIAADSSASSEPLHVEAGQTVTQKINLTARYSIQDFGTYHVRAHVYFPDLGRYFYSPTKVVEIADARPIWKQSVGIPAGSDAGGDARTYSLLTNRFADHTSLYIRVEDERRSLVYATYSLGRVIAFDEPHAEIDRENRLHVLHCSAPRTWSHSVIGLNGQLVSRSTLLETKSRPHFARATDGAITVVGGTTEAAAAQVVRDSVPKLSTRPTEKPRGD